MVRKTINHSYICDELGIGFYLSDYNAAIEAEYWDVLKSCPNQITETKSVVSMTCKLDSIWSSLGLAKPEHMSVSGIFVRSEKDGGTRFLIPERHITELYNDHAMFDVKTHMTISDDAFSNFMIEYNQAKKTASATPAA